MSNSIKRFIQKFDMYSIGVQFNFKEQEKQKSVFGGIISMISFIFMGFTFWYYGKDLYYKANPYVVSSLREVIQAEKIYVNKDNIILMVGVQTAQSYSFVDPTIFSMTAVFQNMETVYNSTRGISEKKLISYPREMNLCNENDVGRTGLQDYFKKINVSLYYCFQNQNQVEKNYIEGGFDQEKFSQMYIYVKRCTNSTQPNSVICKPPEVISSIMENTKLSLYMSDMLVVPQDFEHPFLDKGINQYSQISSNFQKEVQIYYSNNYIETDHGLMSQDKNYLRGFSFAEIRETIIHEQTEVICRVLLRIRRQKEDFMQRRYQNIFDVAAKLGGLIKIITIVGALITKPFQKFQFHKRIVNEIFSFQTEQKPFSPNYEQANNHRSKAVSLDVYNHEKQSPGKTQNFDSYERNTRRNGNYLKQVMNIFNTSKDALKYKCTDYFAHFFCPKHSSIEMKKPLLDYSIKKVLQNMDIIYILNKLIEIDKLKYILFDEDQIKLFEFIPRPVVTIFDTQVQESPENHSPNIIGQSYNIKKVKVPKFYIQADKSRDQKAHDAQKSLNHISQKMNKSLIDQKLLNAIDPSLVNYKSLNVNSKHSNNNLQIGDKTFHFSQIEISPSNQNQFDEIMSNNNNPKVSITLGEIDQVAQTQENSDPTIVINPIFTNNDFKPSNNLNSLIQLRKIDTFKDNDISYELNLSTDPTQSRINHIKFNSIFFDKFKETYQKNIMQMNDDEIIHNTS